MSYKILCFPVLLLFCTLGIHAQTDLSGEWEGVLSQEGKDDKFIYRVNIRQYDSAIKGTSFSSTESGDVSAKFNITGIWDKGRLILQEIEQLEPKKPRWCHKYMTLQLTDEDGVQKLAGDWKAENCTPGTIELTRLTFANIKTSSIATEEEVIEKEMPFTMDGKWTGQLTQTDRDYGFYYQFDLDGASGGESYIVSEGNGGSANHALKWTFDESTPMLSVEERRIDEKSDENWRWCIKTAELKLRKENLKYVLEGEWKGFIEGYDQNSGPCAPGKLYLEKPIEIERSVVTKHIENPYEKIHKRKVQIERVLEVHSPQLKIKVWDNGTVDGDIVTLYLNGTCLLQNYRVTKHKVGFPVTLRDESNFLILHAEDLGDIMPNTVAVSIDDGVEEQVIILSSNLETSGAVLIKEFKLKGSGNKDNSSDISNR
jgi:hypothetical protein